MIIKKQVLVIAIIGFFLLVANYFATRLEGAFNSKLFIILLSHFIRSFAIPIFITIFTLTNSNINKLGILGFLLLFSFVLMTVEFFAINSSFHIFNGTKDDAIYLALWGVKVVVIILTFIILLFAKKGVKV